MNAKCKLKLTSVAVGYKIYVNNKPLSSHISIMLTPRYACAVTTTNYSKAIYVYVYDCVCVTFFIHASVRPAPSHPPIYSLIHRPIHPSHCTLLKRCWHVGRTLRCSEAWHGSVKMGSDDNFIYRKEFVQHDQWLRLFPFDDPSKSRFQNPLRPFPPAAEKGRLPPAAEKGRRRRRARGAEFTRWIASPLISTASWADREEYVCCTSYILDE